MVNVPQHTIKLQDGSLFSFKRRFKHHSISLLEVFRKVRDGRRKFGKRHELTFILLILFGGITAGYTTIKDCRLWVLHNRKWLHRYIVMPHGIPDERTLSRAIQKLDIDSLVDAFSCWQQILLGQNCSRVASFDGKTMRGIHGANVIRHILSLFTHQTHQILGQIGVEQKENEIPAFRRLLEQTTPYGLLLVGDALHTQKETVKDILLHKAHYLLFVKMNQEQLAEDIMAFFNDIPWGVTVEQKTFWDDTHGRRTKTKVTVSHNPQMLSFLVSEWQGIQTIGKIERVGTRIAYDGKETSYAETVYCIASKKLTAMQVAYHTRNHWQIENNLHWEKDWIFLEDRQTLRSGKAPEVMTFLRSMCISVFALFQFSSISQTIHNFQMNQSLHHQFLSLSGVV